MPGGVAHRLSLAEIYDGALCHVAIANSTRELLRWNYCTRYQDELNEGAAQQAWKCRCAAVLLQCYTLRTHVYHAATYLPPGFMDKEPRAHFALDGFLQGWPYPAAQRVCKIGRSRLLLSENTFDCFCMQHQIDHQHIYASSLTFRSCCFPPLSSVGVAIHSSYNLLEDGLQLVVFWRTHASLILEEVHCCVPSVD